MSFRVCRVAFEQIIGPDRDRNLLALIDFDNGKSFDLHHSSALVLVDAKRSGAASAGSNWQPLCQKSRWRRGFGDFNHQRHGTNSKDQTAFRGTGNLIVAAPTLNAYDASE